MSEEYSGRIMRLLMDNHSRSRATHKADVAELLSIKTKDVEAAMDGAAELLARFELELVRLPVDGAGGPSEKLSDKYFVRRAPAKRDKRARIEPCSEEKQLYFMIAAVMAENNALEDSKLPELAGCRLFDGVSIGDYLRKQKACGYFSSSKVGDGVVWSLGWRARAEFEDGFDLLEYFKTKYDME
ncbi:hypothetical protein PAPHI01_2195 [Pancytospora philotis]|nr:hypothetical protein PAPHI01_2195 [Pancytospora philotis]